MTNWTTAFMGPALQGRVVRELTVAVRMNKQGNNKWKKKLKQQEGLEMAGGQRMSAGCSETLRKASLGSRHTLRRKWGLGGGGIPYRKTGAKGSQHLISVYCSFFNCPRLTVQSSTARSQLVPSLKHVWLTAYVFSYRVYCLLEMDHRLSPASSGINRRDRQTS